MPSAPQWYSKEPLTVYGKGQIKVMLEPANKDEILNVPISITGVPTHEILSEQE